MKAAFSWLPIGTKLVEGATVGRATSEGVGYQIIESQSTNQKALIITKDAGWITPPGSSINQLTHLAESKILLDYIFGEDSFWIAIFTLGNEPVRVSSLIEKASQHSFQFLKELAYGLREMSDNFNSSIWDEALYLPGEKECLAIQFEKNIYPMRPRRELAVKLLVGNVGDSSLSVETIKKLNGKLSITEIREFFSILGFEDENLMRSLMQVSVSNPSDFSLPGRPELEAFFKEYVIDYFYRISEYSKMGIKPPNGILLYGPPGTGKSYAVQQLANFLKWPVYDIDIASVGSPYIHQTSKMLKEIFDKAASTAPSVVLLEEFDAIGGSRSGVAHEHKIEEVSQLLRVIETASKQGILVIATTNRYHSIDEAIVRKGRFDHVIEVGLPSQEEIMSALNNLLKGRPLAKELDLTAVSALLENHPMSDVAWVVNEAARSAVKSQKGSIDTECFKAAISRLTK